MDITEEDKLTLINGYIHFLINSADDPITDLVILENKYVSNNFSYKLWEMFRIAETLYQNNITKINSLKELDDILLLL